MEQIFGQKNVNDVSTCKELLILDENDSSNSIAAGGVFLSSEKDHLNFEVEKLMSSTADERIVLQKLDESVVIQWTLNETKMFVNATDSK